jgi:ABC-type Zn uptake system ZnuABC Zn-binding protein ZnuA
MYKFFIIAFVLLISCQSQYSKPLIVTTSHPFAEILREVAGSKVEVVCLTQPGDSPHTYSPKPSDAAKASSALAFFYGADNLDPWALKMESKNKYKLIDLVPEDMKIEFCHDCAQEGHSHEGEKHGGVDPHFWTDPMVVKAILPKIADILGKLDPASANSYKNNAATFSKRLDLLNREVDKLLSGQKGKDVFLFHPSFLYFLKRYGLNYAGAIETAPGKEPSAKYLKEISDKIKKTGAKAIYSEPQLNMNSAKTVAENAGVLLFELDPIGGSAGRMKYADLILYNAKILMKSL